METPDFLADLVVLFGLAAVVSYTFRLVRLSSLAGFIVAGALIGPFGLRLISSTEEVHGMAEVGVMLLLFSIGVEFSTEKLLRMKWLVLGGGGLQVLLTGGVAALVVSPWTPSISAAIFTGILTALSSTVIAMRLLYDRQQTFAPQGSTSLAILIFQDIAVVPIMLFLPLLTGRQSLHIRSLVTTTAASLLAVFVILAVAWFVAPRLIAATIEARSRDIFILSVISVIVGTAYLSSRVGLSTALGAFVAGLVISGSEYSHQVLADVLPFRETFNSLFFVSIGMLLNPSFLMSHLFLILAISLAVMIGKTVITAGVVALLGMPLRIAIVVGLYLAQIGEFSLVLLTAAEASGAFPPALGQMALSVTLVTMTLTPFAAEVADRIGWMAGSQAAAASDATSLADHTVIVGYGLNGQNVAAALRSHEMPYAIIEMNPRTVRSAGAAGEPIHYGDAISEVVLRTAGLAKAQCVVFAISDPAATRHAVSTARRMNAGVYIIARTRYVSEIEQLYAAGADTVIAEEFETSLEIIRRILGRFGYRPTTIDRDILAVRQRRYEIFRGAPVEKVPIRTDVGFEPFEVEVRKQGSGRTLAEIGVREHSGATVIAARRGSEVLPNPSPAHRLQDGDHVYLIGSEEEIRRAMRLL